MAIPIQLPDGRSIVVDPVTGNIISDAGSNIDYAQRAGERGGVPLPPPPAEEPPAFNPAQDEVLDMVKLPDGSTQITYASGGQQYKTVVPRSAPAGSGGVSATSIYSQQQQNARDATALAEEQRQFDQTLGYNKARYDQDYALDRGKTLLSLGTRPDTLIKYLHALRGQQTPQGLQNTTANLPGFQNIIGGTNYGQSPAAAGAAPSPQAAAAPAAVPSVRQAIATPGPIAPSFVAPGGTNITAAPPPSIRPEDQALLAQGRIPRFYSDGAAIYADGGIVPEPVIGTGLFSGKPYIFGERGPETVVPHGETLAENKNQPPSITGSYADGGTIGYASPYEGLSGFSATGAPYRLSPNDPDAAGLMAKYPGMYQITSAAQAAPYLAPPSLGQSSAPPLATPRPVAQTPGASMTGGFAPPSLFNPGSSSILNNIGGQFPQVGHFTGGGQSLIPSVQKLSNSLGSERSFYAGFLQDQAGLPPEDVFELAAKLNPGKVRGLTTPRYA